MVDNSKIKKVERVAHVELSDLKEKLIEKK